jgi:POT family proton-dependent oligopeptide transporter
MSDTPEAPRKGFFASFPRTFWVANVMELFERGAYYGLNALLGRYLTDKAGGALGFTEDRAGLLQSVVYALTYIVPILGGALADRYGYRRMLLFAFSLLSGGYFLSGQVDGYWVIFASLLIMATGSGLFKPIISGTIARTTDEKNSGFGFGIYYWTINVGAFVAPLVAGWLKGRFDWSAVFTASSLYCAAMLLPTLFVYRDPPRPASTKTFKEVLGGALTVLSDARFMLLIFVYSCFWILYFQNFGTVLWYLRDFIDPTPLNDGINHAVNGLLAMLGSDGRIDFRLDAEHVTVVNAGTIVLLQVVVSRVVKNLPALPTMVGGIVIGSLGFFCLAISTNPWIFILGIAVFSVGEMTAHPKYFSYMGIVAPQDRKAVYMGYTFLYGVVGSLVGSNVGGEAYAAILTPLKGKAGSAATLRWFWLVFAFLGVATSLLLVVYNRYFGVDSPETQRRARRVMLIVYAFLLVAALGLGGWVTWSKGELPVKTAIQAGIMILVGGGGLLMLLRSPKTT